MHTAIDLTREAVTEMNRAKTLPKWRWLASHNASVRAVRLARLSRLVAAFEAASPPKRTEECPICLAWKTEGRSHPCDEQIAVMREP